MGILAVEPFSDFRIIGMIRGGRRFEHLVESVDSTAVFRRTLEFTGYEAMIGSAGIAGAYDEGVFPVTCPPQVPRS